jgi:hypothetical protein
LGLITTSNPRSCPSHRLSQPDLSFLKISRNRRFTLLRTCAFPTCRPTVKPKRTKGPSVGRKNSRRLDDSRRSAPLKCSRYSRECRILFSLGNLSSVTGFSFAFFRRTACYKASRFRPFFRRLFMTSRPARVFIRERKPCFLFLFRLCGRYVGCTFPAPCFYSLCLRHDFSIAYDLTKPVYYKDIFCKVNDNSAPLVIVSVFFSIFNIIRYLNPEGSQKSEIAYNPPQLQALIKENGGLTRNENSHYSWQSSK